VEVNEVGDCRPRLTVEAEVEELDVFVDARQESPTFGQWFSYELNDDIPQILYIPRGFYHGYMTLTDDVIVHYQQDEFFTPECEQGLIWNDPTLQIDWQLGGAEPIVSIKDAQQPTWDQVHKF
jgi:dTDP-4-dehydrorhamnose 3,5-epimerase